MPVCGAPGFRTNNRDRRVAVGGHNQANGGGSDFAEHVVKRRGGLSDSRIIEMTLGFRSLRVAIALACWLAAGPASAGSLVEFPNLPGRTPSTLRGYLARPDSGLSAIVGETPADEPTAFPAVVVLHGCSGVTSH